MPIELYTGKPGNGKTALLVERLLKAAKEGGRPIYQHGIDGLEPGLAHDIPDIRQWNTVGSDSYVPDGALVFVDEAWKWFGHLTDPRGANPPHVLALAEHRHRGIDFVWTTQGPNQLYPFARPLIADHFHCVRRFGTQMIDVFHWEELQEDIKSTTRRESAQRTTRALPKEAFGKYKSAEVHTIKRRIPMRVLALPLLLIAAVGLTWAAFQVLRPANAGTTESQAPAAAGAGLTGDAEKTTAIATPATPEEWAQKFIPRIPGVPMSAPAYDDRPIVAEPRLACAIGERMGCVCMTEQGTKVYIDQLECVAIVQDGGRYDPWKRPQNEATGAPAPQAAPAPIEPGV